jgi:hypothetical protein
MGPDDGSGYRSRLRTALRGAAIFPVHDHSSVPWGSLGFATLRPWMLST